MNNLKLYENVVIGNFLYGLGFAIRAKSNRSVVPSVVNLLQQTPADKELADVLLEFPGVVRLIEFKQLNNKSEKELARYNQLTAAIGKNENMIRLSKSIHWFVETNPDNKTFVSRIVPYLDAYPRDKKTRDNKKRSLEQFIEDIAEDAVNEQTNFSNEKLRSYLSLVAHCQGSGKVGTGGLLLAINAEGSLRFIELIDMMELRLQHRLFAEKRIIEMQQTLERKPQQEPKMRNRNLAGPSL